MPGATGQHSLAVSVLRRTTEGIAPATALWVVGSRVAPTAGSSPRRSRQLRVSGDRVCCTIPSRRRRAQPMDVHGRGHGALPKAAAMTSLAAATTLAVSHFPVATGAGAFFPSSAREKTSLRSGCVAPGWRRRRRRARPCASSCAARLWRASTSACVCPSGRLSWWQDAGCRGRDPLWRRPPPRRAAHEDRLGPG